MPSDATGEADAYSIALQANHRGYDEDECDASDQADSSDALV